MISLESQSSRWEIIRIYLDEEEKIFDFIYNIVPKLQEHSNVYYSESFKKTILREPASFSGGLN